MKFNLLIFVSFFFFINAVDAQNTPIKSAGGNFDLYFKGQDTAYVINFPDIPITAPYFFKDAEEEKLFRRYKRYAQVVYPYAVEAVKVFRKVQDTTTNMGYWDRRSHIKGLQKELKAKFEDKLTNLSKTQGKVLIKMIERELNVPMYDMVSEVKGGFTATYWTFFSSFYGYHLKHGYVKGEENILDYVLQMPEYQIPDK
ncbi:MAG: hypothetical protein RLZZ292_183 [Bacteroidota bacterium]|jgi:hypothetical protein